MHNVLFLQEALRRHYLDDCIHISKEYIMYCFIKKNNALNE